MTCVSTPERMSRVVSAPSQETNVFRNVRSGRDSHPGGKAHSEAVAGLIQCDPWESVALHVGRKSAGHKQMGTTAPHIRTESSARHLLNPLREVRFW